jgi:ArsR family transcriptional regulator, arsenate/arsenite/antimonite-responsive transcriptional repressor
MKMTDAVAVLDALAQESRLEIFRFLIRAGAEGASAGRIGEHMALHAATLSFHLNALKQAGLVSARRESRSIIYTASFARMRDLVGYLTHNCCRGELTAPFEAALEAGRARAA